MRVHTRARAHTRGVAQGEHCVLLTLSTFFHLFSLPLSSSLALLLVFLLLHQLLLWVFHPHSSGRFLLTETVGRARDRNRSSLACTVLSPHCFTHRARSARPRSRRKSDGNGPWDSQSVAVPVNLKMKRHLLSQIEGYLAISSNMCGGILMQKSGFGECFTAAALIYRCVMMLKSSEKRLPHYLAPIWKHFFKKKFPGCKW